MSEESIQPLNDDRPSSMSETMGSLEALLAKHSKPTAAHDWLPVLNWGRARGLIEYPRDRTPKSCREDGRALQRAIEADDAESVARLGMPAQKKELAEDVLPGFLDTQCVTEEGASVSFLQFKKRLQAYLDAEGKRAPAPIDQKFWLRDHGHRVEKQNGVNVVPGLRLKPQDGGGTTNAG